MFNLQDRWSSFLLPSVPIVGRRQLPSLILLRLLQIQGYPPVLLLRPPSHRSKGRDSSRNRNGLRKRLPPLLRHLHQLKFLLGISPSMSLFPNPPPLPLTHNLLSPLSPPLSRLPQR